MSQIKISADEPATGFSYDDNSLAVSGITIRAQFASNAQAAIISNADTLREITKASSGAVLSAREGMFFRAVARVAVQHADALLEALNE